MALYPYPAKHFPETPDWVKPAIKDALAELSRRNLILSIPEKWWVPMEAIARYESDFNLTKPQPWGEPSMTGQDPGQYHAAHVAFPALVPKVDYEDARQAVLVAALYIRGHLPGYAGYGSLGNLLARHDRGPGDALREWEKSPKSTMAQLRQYYHGY